MKNQIKSLRLGLVPGLFLALAALATFAGEAGAQSLGSAGTFAVLGASTVTNTGPTQVSGDVGVSPGSAISGFLPGIINNGALHANDGPAIQAHADLAIAYTAFAGLASPPANNLTGSDLGGMTLTPGVYHFDTSAQQSGGTLTFDAQNDPTARFVVQTGTTLITSGTSSVALINGADAHNVYFQVGSSATLGGGSSFIGNILANMSITTVSGTAVTGRLFAVNGAVTLDTNNVGGMTAPVAQLVVSRKTHDATPFDITLPLDGTTGIECRRGSGAGADGHQVIVTFATPITAKGVTVTSTNGLATATQSANGGTVTIDLSSVRDAQTIAITLISVNDGARIGDVSIPMGILLGDVNADRFVNSTDTFQTRNSSGQTTDATNFRVDVNTDGYINSGDTFNVRAQSGTFLQ